MIVAGVDPSLTSTGISIRNEAGEVSLFLVTSAGRADDTDHDHLPRILSIRDRVMRILIENRVDLVVLEGRANSKFDQGVIHWLWGELFKTIVVGAKIPVVVCSPNSMKKFVTDNGAAKKIEVALRVAKMWPTVEINKDDLADALGLMSMGCVKYHLPVPFLVLERHWLAMSKLEWPAQI